MNQNCFICNLPIGISARNCVNIFADNNLLQSGQKLHEVISDIVETTVTDAGHSNVVCKKCQKACSEYDSLKTRLQVIKGEIQESYKRSLQLNTRIGKNNEKPLQKPTETKKIVLPASKLQPLPANYVIEMGKLPGKNMFPRIESVGSLIGSTPGMFKMAKVAISSTVLPQNIKPVFTTSPTKVELLTSPSKVTNTSISSNVIATSLMMPTLNTSSIVTKKTKNPVMSFNVDLPKDFLSSTVLTKEVKKNDMIKKEIVINADLHEETVNNDEQPMEIDEDCSLSVVPVTTDENGKLIFDVDKIDLKSKTANSNFFDVGLLLEGDNASSSERADKCILDKLQILNENLDDDDDDDTEAIVLEGSAVADSRVIRVGRPLYDIDQSDALKDAILNSNDDSQIEIQVSGDEETANAIIAAAQEQGGAFIKVESGATYRVRAVRPPADHLADVVAAMADGQFKCLLCEKNRTSSEDGKSTLVSGDAEAMMRHVKTAHGARVYICAACGRLMRRRSEYSAHIGDAEAMMRHVKTAHGARVYICAACGRLMRRRSEYSAHIEEHAQKTVGIANKTKLHACTTCGKRFRSRTLLAEHAHTHTGAKPHACRCGKAFASKYTLQAHLKTHEERPRPFKCESCGKAFLTQQNLTQHEKTHSGIKEFVCKVCNKAFATQHNLEVHCVVHTGRKPFFCSVCEKGFSRRAEVKDHMRIHTGERPFTCELCGATFTQRSNLHSHKRATHFDDKRHHCAHCPKRFKRRRLLDYHIKAAHTGERPLKCEVCRATFVYPEHYKKHMRIHSGERPYVCEVCGKSFNSRDNRNMHRFVHSDKKPYECLACGAGYMRKQLLYQHMNSTRERESACGAGYMRKQLLYQHMNSTGHVAESIVVNQPKVITAVQNIFETTAELDLDGNEVHTVEDDGTTKLFITEGDKEIVLQEKSEISVLQEGEDATSFLTLHNLNGLIEANVEDKLDDQAQIVTTDEKGNTMRLIQVQLPDGKSGWVALNN